MKYLITICCFVLGISNLVGQDLKKELRELYGSTAKQALEITMYPLDSNLNRTGISQVQKVHSASDHYHFEMNEIEYIFSDTWYIMVSHDAKIVMVNQSKEPFLNDGSSGTMADSILDNIESYIYDGTESGHKKYTITPKGRLYRKMELEINASNGQISNMKYYYSDKNVSLKGGLEIVIKPFEVKSEDRYHYSYYLKEDKGEVSLTTSFQNYELIEQESYAK